MAGQGIEAEPANPGFFHIRTECGHYSGVAATDKGLAEQCAKSE